MCMHICTYTSLSLSLSLCVYIYTYIHIYSNCAPSGMASPIIQKSRLVPTSETPFKSLMPQIQALFSTHFRNAVGLRPLCLDLLCAHCGFQTPLADAVCACASVLRRPCACRAARVRAARCACFRDPPRTALRRFVHRGPRFTPPPLPWPPSPNGRCFATAARRQRGAGSQPQPACDTRAR